MQNVVAVAEPGELEPGQRLALFDYCQQICDDLARMRPVGQPVDHRHAGMARHLLRLRVIVGAEHDRVGHAAEHARGVGDRFAAAELARRGIEHQRRAAELAHGDIEADPGARRILLEHHRQYVPGERSVGVGLASGPLAARRLALLRVMDHRGERVGPRIGKVEEVANGHQAASGIT